jgi:hypothetical protein
VQKTSAAIQVFFMWMETAAPGAIFPAVTKECWIGYEFGLVTEEFASGQEDDLSVLAANDVDIRF